MKFFSVKSFIRVRYLLAMGVGLLLSASFPNLGIAGFAWVAPGLLVAIALGRSSKESFWIGYTAGMAHYLASLSWLLNIPYRWNGIPLGPALGWIALSAFLSMFPAAWTWMAVKVLALKCQVSEESSLKAWLAPIRALSLVSWTRRMYWALGCAAMWVAVEMVVARIFGGFPWNLLGASQYQLVHLIQFASVTGVYGISFLLVWTSVSLLNAAAAILHRPQVRSIWLAEIALPLAAVTAAFAFGSRQLAQSPTASHELKVTFVQPSIPQSTIWDSASDLARFENLIEMSEKALAHETDVLLWPEAALPRALRYNADMFHAITNLAGTHRVWMIVGSDDIEPRPGATDPNDNLYFNASFLISPRGELMNRYVKRNLVIFGEYIPLEHILPFMKYLMPWMPGSFTSGKGPVPFEMQIPVRRRPSTRPGNGENQGVPETGAPEQQFLVKTSVLICFEDNFPHLVHTYVEDDTDFLINLTNNGWFGEGAAQWQHAANAVFRAVENRRPLVRCTNNGLTCWVDTNGQLRDVFRDRTGSIYGAGFMTVKIPLLPPEAAGPRTFYNRHGDWFGWGCVAATIAALGLTKFRKYT